jgi:hypothetical protein
MKLRATRARLVATSALGLGISLVLAAATLISRHFIESTASHSRAPLLRPAAVFAPTLLRPGAGDKEIDAVSGFDPQAAIARAASIAKRAAGKAVADDQAEDARPAHAPAPVPEELLLSLAPPVGGPDPFAAAAPAGVPPRSPAARTSHPPDAPAASAPRSAPAEPRLEMIDENLWRP